MNNLTIAIGDNSKVFALPEQAQAVNAVVQRFSSCPAAKELLNKVSSLVQLTLRIDDVAAYSTVFPALAQATITIPSNSSNLPYKDPNLPFAFELMNAKNHDSSDAVVQTANEGRLGMEDYTKELITIDAEALLAKQDLGDQCKRTWNLRGPESPPFRDLKSMSWLGEWICQADSHREKWIQLHQEKYCQSHPEDKASCEAKADSFCYSKYLKASFKQRNDIRTQRLCDKFFASAPEIARPDLVDMVRKACPDVLKETKTDL